MIKVSDIVKIYKNGNIELKVLKGLNLEVMWLLWDLLEVVNQRL